MQKVKQTISDAAKSMEDLKVSLLRRFKPGMSAEEISRTNKQIDRVNLVLEALGRITPAKLRDDKCCPFCGRDLQKEYEIAQDTVYCCMYCGQALELEVTA